MIQRDADGTKTDPFDFGFGFYRMNFFVQIDDFMKGIFAAKENSRKVRMAF
ncbi:hypothetical protein BSM4216_2332 [Bacillus smithii]|nr:hypothetical protein BSM4216_2332 [Bacillus smithii]